MVLSNDIAKLRLETGLSFEKFLNSFNRQNKLMGVYMIYCTGNDKPYIGGTSKTFLKRIGQHLGSIKRGDKCCTKLYHAVKKYGVSSFDVTILETTLDKSKVVELENKYLEIVCKAISDKVFLCYNTLNIRDTSIIRSINNSRSGNETSHPCPYKGMKLTKEWSENIGKSMLGRIVSDETRKKLSLKNKGQKRTSEFSLVMSNMKKGVDSSKRVPLYQFTNDLILVRKYEFVNQVKNFGYSPGNISQYCSGKRKCCYNSIWSFHDLREVCNDIAA